MSGRPLFDRVVVLPDSAKETTETGIFIPEAAKEVPATGTVLAAGPLAQMVSPGDHVLYGKYAGTQTTIDGQSVIILRVGDILFVEDPQQKP